MPRRVDERQNSAEAVAEEGHAVDAGFLANGVDRARHVLVAVRLERVASVELVRSPPVEEEDVQARREKILDHAAPWPEIEDVRATHEAHDE
jgi:hypothetical protein